MSKIFLSYRREDSTDVAGRIHDRLVAHFGNKSVFMDLDSIPYGVDFRLFVSDWINKSDVLLAVVGNNWLEVRDATGKLRLGDLNDFVTIEISTAMQKSIPVVPLLVGKADMPNSTQLPDVLSQFAFCNAAEVRSGREFHAQMDRLIRDIEHQIETQSARRKLVEKSMLSQKRENTSTKVKYVFIEEPAVAIPTNLGFEDKVVEGMPEGWSNSCNFVSGVSTQYSVDVVRRENGVTGRCLRMQRTKAGSREFGSIMQRFPVHNMVGKHIRVEAELRTEKLDSWAGLWVRIDSESTQLFFDNMHDRPIKGTTRWSKYEIVAHVPKGSEWMNFGILLSSNGVLWADNFQVNIV